MFFFCTVILLFTYRGKKKKKYENAEVKHRFQLSPNAHLDDLAILTGGEVMQSFTPKLISNIYIYTHTHTYNMQSIFLFFSLLYFSFYAKTFIVQVISEDRGLTLDKVQFEMLGTAKKVYVFVQSVLWGWG